MKRWLVYALLFVALVLPAKGQDANGVKPDIWIYAVAPRCTRGWYNTLIANFLELGVVAKPLPSFDKAEQGSGVLMVFPSPSDGGNCSDSELMRHLGSGLLGALQLAEEKGVRVLFVFEGVVNTTYLELFNLSDVLIGKFGFMLKYLWTSSIFGKKEHLSAKYFLPGLQDEIIGPIYPHGSVWAMIFPPNQQKGKMRPIATLTTGRGEKLAFSAINHNENLLLVSFPSLNYYNYKSYKDIFYHMHQDNNRAVVAKLLDWLRTGEPLW